MKIFIMFVSILFSFTTMHAKKSLDILIFNSYSQTLPWSQQLRQGLENFDKKSSYKINYYIETIDYTRLKNQMNGEEWKKYLSQKYKGIVFDGVVIETIFASKVFQEFSNILYRDIPKVYFSEIDISGQFNAIKVFQSNKKSVKKTLRLIKKNNQNIENIYLIKPHKGGEEFEKIIKEEFENEFLNTFVLENFTFKGLQKTLSNLPKNSAVLYLFNFEEREEKTVLPQEFLQQISAVSNSPIYSFWSTFIGKGTIGGYMLDGENAIGVILENLVYFIENKQFREIQIKPKLFLDHEVLQKYSISSYPQEAVIINKPISIWKLYPQETFFALSIMSFLSFFLMLTFLLKLRNEKILKMEESMFVRSKHAAMGEMISVIAHQWRQPLNNIALIVQNIFFKYSIRKIDDAMMKDFKIDLLKQIEYMSNTIDDFKDFYKPNKKKVEFNIKKEIIKTVALTKVMFEKKDIIVRFSDLEDVTLLGYPRELRHCFLILLQNAHEALDESDKKQKLIEIIGKKVKKEYIITFKNNGKSIPSELLEKIFEPYFSTKSEKNGTGIGLYMARIMIEKHFKGSLKVMNINDGVKFEIRLVYV